MKKLLTLFMMLLLSIASTWADEVVVDRSGWSVTAYANPTSAIENANDGRKEAMLDGSTTTWFHSAWKDKPANQSGDDATQAFMIDMADEVTLTKITLLPRSNGAGAPTVWRIYVYGSDATPVDLISLTSSNVQSSLSEATLGTPTLSGTWADDATLKTATFTTPVTGRYILFIADDRHLSDAKWLCVSEFKAYHETRTVTYNYKIDGKTVATKQFVVDDGDAYPTPSVPTEFEGISTDFYSIGAKPEGAVTADVEKDITVTQSLPFPASSSFENANWYLLKFDFSDAGNCFLYYKAGDDPITKNRVSTDLSDRDLFCAVGNVVDGFRIYNKAAGQNYILSSSTTMSGDKGADTYPIMTDISGGVPSGNNEFWDITKSSNATNGFFLGQHGFPSNRINNRNGKIAYWTGGAGTGSTFVAVSPAAIKLPSTEKLYKLQNANYPTQYVANTGNTCTDVEGSRGIVMIEPAATDRQYYISVNGKYLKETETSTQITTTTNKSEAVPYTIEMHCDMSHIVFMDATKTWADPYRNFIHCNGTKSLVGWAAGAPASQWMCHEVEGSYVVYGTKVLTGISGYESLTSIVVTEGSTLTVDVENFDLTKISGAGNIVLAASTSLTDNKSTAVTGKLTINAGKTLTIGSGDTQTNSVASFTSIDLLGTIYHKNSAATLNNVTVPADATGIIYSYDMGKTTDGFRLAGTTAVNGTLYVCNKWNFQMKVDQLTGSGTWTICGTTGSDFNASGTSSSEAATINVADSPSFTGTVNMNSTNATTNVNGTLQANTIAGSGKLAGAGTVRLLTFPGTSAPNLTGWTGTVEFPAVTTSQGNLTDKFNAWGNANSTINVNNVTGWFVAVSPSALPAPAATVNPTLNILSGATLTVNDGYSDKTAVLTKVTGAGTLATVHATSSATYTLNITTLTDFTGILQANYRPIVVNKLVLASAPYPNTRLIKTSANGVTLEELYIGLQKTTAYSWEKNTVEGVTGFYVTGVDQVQLAREDAINTISPYYNYVGTGVGKYTVRLSNVDYTDIDEVESAIQDWNLTTPIPVIITFNQPTSGYYMLKSKYNETTTTGYYLQCENLSTADDTNAKQTTTTDEKNIFYITVGESNSTIKSYVTGYYFGKYTRANYTADTVNPAHWTFTEGHNKGTYTLTSDYSGSKILYGWSGTNNNVKADRNPETTTDGHTDWILVPVAAEDLPVILAPGSTDNNKKILGSIQTVEDVKGKITAATAFVDLSEATITDTDIDAIKGAVAEVNQNAIIIAPQGTVPGSATTNVLLKADEGKYTCNNLQLTDDVVAQFNTKYEFTIGTTVNYTRASSANQWGTICLPYAVSTDGDVAYYRLVDPVGNQTLRFERVTEETTTANEPYLIKKGAGEGFVVGTTAVEDFSLGDDEVQSTAEHNTYKLQGVMVNTSVVNGTTYTDPYTDKGYQQAVIDPNAYYFEASSNTFRALNGRFNLKAFRAYLSTTDDTSNARSILGIDISEDGQSTGISFVESEDGKTVDVVFDLNGRRLQEAKKGINIINGKKVIK